MKEFDYIILGAGCAGLSLAYELDIIKKLKTKSLAIVEIRDLNTFEVLHSYLPNIQKIYEKIDLTKEEFKYLKRDLGLNRFHMRHPVINSKGELIFQSNSPLVKVDFNSKIVWVNDEDKFHHSINLDLDENIYVTSWIFPYSKKVASLISSDGKDYSLYDDDAINILNEEYQTNNHLLAKSISILYIRSMDR